MLLLATIYTPMPFDTFIIREFKTKSFLSYTRSSTCSCW